jgi:hypothetical protein
MCAKMKHSLHTNQTSFAEKDHQFCGGKKPPSSKQKPYGNKKEIESLWSDESYKSGKLKSC